MRRCFFFVSIHSCIPLHIPVSGLLRVHHPLFHFPGSWPASWSTIHHRPTSLVYIPLCGHFSFYIRGWSSALPRLCPLGGLPSPLPQGHTEVRAESGRGRSTGLCCGLQPECTGQSSKGLSEVRDGLTCGFQRRLRLPCGRAAHACAWSGAHGVLSASCLGGSVTGSSWTGPKLRCKGWTLASLSFADATLRRLSNSLSYRLLILRYWIDNTLKILARGEEMTLKSNTPILLHCEESISIISTEI